MRIAVIGATGWIGGAAVREALARGHEVTAIARDTSHLDDSSGLLPSLLTRSTPPR